MTIAAKTADLTKAINDTVKELQVTQASLDAQVSTAEGYATTAATHQATAEGYRDTTATHAADAATHLATVQANVTYEGIEAILAEKAVTAVDVFIYDTSLDSDGGAWRKRTQHTSWYNEELNTATRGSRREFPAVAVIVAASGGGVTIYDGDDPSLPMWMVFPYVDLNTGYVPSRWPSAVRMLNGELVFTSYEIGQAVYSGCIQINFIKDNAYRRLRDNNYSFTGLSRYPITGRTTIYPWLGYGSYSHKLLSGLAYVYDAAMTVLPNTPIDHATGLPAPTIAVATDVGISVITDSGAVYNITNSNSAYTASFNVSFDSRHNLWLDQGSHSLSYNGWVYVFSMPLSGNTTITLNSQNASGDDPIAMFQRLIASGGSIDFGVTGGDSLIAESYFATNAGIGAVDINYNDSTKSMAAKITSTFNTGYQIGEMKGAFLSDTDDTDLVEAEMVANGTFNTDTSGWSGSQATLSWEPTGAMRVTSIGYYNRYAIDYRVFPTGWYVMTFDLVEAALGTGGGATCGIWLNNLDNSAIATVTIPRTYSGAPRRYTLYAYVTQNSQNQIRLGIGSNTGYAIFDNVSIRKVDTDRSVKNRGLTINGTITRSPVADGAELMGYSGFSAANYLEQPYNSALDFGTGDFCVVGWVNFTGFVGNQHSTIVARNDPEQADEWTFQYATDNNLQFRSGAANIVSAGVLPSGWAFVAAVRSSGVLSAYINGVLKSSAAFAAPLTNTTDNPPLRVGFRSAAYPGAFGGSLALLRISATIPTPDQIRKIYEDERKLFMPGAQCTLYGTSDAVTALAHDPKTNLLHVGTSAGRSTFDGLVRVANTTTPVGTAISAVNGLIVEE